MKIFRENFQKPACWRKTGKFPEFSVLKNISTKMGSVTFGESQFWILLCKKSEKTNEFIPKKAGGNRRQNERANERTDGQTDKSRSKNLF